MMNRRRFITISAASLVASKANASAIRWHGRAMGAEVSLALYGGTDSDLKAALAEVSRLEKLFSLYDPNSEISRINAKGGGAVSPAIADLLKLCDTVNHTTNGLFDPTIQSVFRALLEGRDAPWHLVGWDRVRLGADQVSLGKQQEITLNGIAQGYATDRVRDVLRELGFTKALVSVGEHAAIGGPFRLSLQDPDFGSVGVRTIEDTAMATSSPGAMKLGRGNHIFDPHGQTVPRWSTISIEAESAALADGLSTALCLAPLDLVEGVVAKTGTRATLVDLEGDLVTIG